MMLVTSFSKKGYEKYGKKMLESAIECFPGEIVVYSEDLDDWSPELHSKVSYRHLFDVHGCKSFLEYCDRAHVFHGKTPFGYDYNHDAAKFCKKVFAQLDAFTLEQGKVFWVDADTVFHTKLPESFYVNLFEDQPLVFMGREGFHTEGGIVGFDVQHPDFEKFKEWYVRCYQKGLLFTLPQWHDCAAFDWAREQSGVLGHNLTPNWKPGDDLDVLRTTELGKHITHYKGIQKYAQ